MCCTPAKEKAEAKLKVDEEKDVSGMPYLIIAETH
jgi:hypothetical protein